MNELLNQAKKEIAKKHGFSSWFLVIVDSSALNISDMADEVALRYQELCEEWVSVDEIKIVVLKNTFHCNKGDEYSLDDFKYLSGRDLEYALNHKEEYSVLTKAKSPQNQ